MYHRPISHERKEAPLQPSFAAATSKRTVIRPHLWVVLGAALFLTGCSTLKFWYSFADNFIESRAEDYLEMDTKRVAELEKQTTALVAWHKKAMLPKYAAFFNGQADIVEAGGWDRARISDAIDSFRVLVDETLKGASPYIARVLADHMREDKLAYLEDRMAEFIAERKADHKTESPAERLKERVDRQVRNISRFVGSLDENQIAIVRDHLKKRGGDRSRWLKNREKRNAALISFLRTQPEQAEIARFVHRIVLRSHEITDPDYKTYSDTYWASLKDMFYDIAVSLSEDQRREFVSTLRGYATDMTDLSVGS